MIILRLYGPWELKFAYLPVSGVLDEDGRYIRIFWREYFRRIYLAPELDIADYEKVTIAQYLNLTK